MGQEVCSGFALAARAACSRLALRARSSRFALAARAWRSPLALRARRLHYVLAARALPLQLARSPLVCTDSEKTKKETLYEFVLYNLYKNCMILYKFVQKPTNSYVTICIQFVYNLYSTNCVVQIVLYKLCCMNSYNKKKRNKNSHRIPTHALIMT